MPHTRRHDKSEYYDKLRVFIYTQIVTPSNDGVHLGAIRMQYYVYILASAFRGTLYVGVTNDLIRRIFEHKSKAVPGFTKRYDVDMLVYYEIHDSIEMAILREKLIKKWRREIKYEAIERENPYWHDLYETLV